MNRFLLVSSAFLLSGCGTFRKVGSFVDTVFSQDGPPKIEPASDALDLITILGFWTAVAGVVTYAISLSPLPFTDWLKHVGIWCLTAGFSICAGSFLLEEYAYTFIWIAAAMGLGYGCFLVGNKAGVKLGYDRGKAHIPDYKEGH